MTYRQYRTCGVARVRAGWYVVARPLAWTVLAALWCWLVTVLVFAL